MAWLTTTWWKRCYEGLRGARFVSPFHFANCYWPCWVLCFGVCLFASFVLVWPVIILQSISFSHLLRISSCWPTMSRTRSAMLSCIAERARSIVGQLLETWNELVQIECRIFTRPSQKSVTPFGSSVSAQTLTASFSSGLVAVDLIHLF